MAVPKRRATKDAPEGVDLLRDVMVWLCKVFQFHAHSLPSDDDGAVLNIGLTAGDPALAQRRKCHLFE